MSSPSSEDRLFTFDPTEPLPVELPLQYLYFVVDESAESFGQPEVLPGSSREVM